MKTPLAALLLCVLSVPSGAGSKPKSPDAVLMGLDVLEREGFAPLLGKRVGLIANKTARDLAGRSSAEVLLESPHSTLAALFSPEHGWEGSLPAGTKVASDRSEAGLPVYSLYGETLRPTEEMLQGLDALVFDMQDVGARFYTYLTTMAYAMEEAAKKGLTFIVLDRPDPIGGDVVEGAVLDPGVRAFTAYLPVATRHGLTPGEAARLFKDKAGLKLDLVVVEMRGWRRSMRFDQTGRTWVPPSPNMPDVESALLYPGLGAFEATNLAVGRGSLKPFRWVGAPWLDSKTLAARLKKLDLPGFAFRVEDRTPEAERYKGLPCNGVAVEITDARKARPVDLFVRLACLLRELHPQDFEPRWPEVARMTGTPEFEKLYKAGASPETILESFHESARRFARDRKKYLLYH